MDLAYTEVFDAIVDAFGDREAIVWRGARRSYAQVRAQANQFAHLLAAHGIGLVGDPDTVDGWRSPHDHVALYLRNDPAYLIGMLGAWRARACATNINYRYVADELTGVLNDQSAAAIVYHGAFGDTLAEVLERIDPPRLLLRVDDGSADSLLPGALDFQSALADLEDRTPPRGDQTASDRYILYTGGTTGAPKGVMWRQGDFMVRALGLVHRDGSEFATTAEVVERAGHRAGLRSMPLPPFMHGAAHWNALSTWLSGGTVVLADEVVTFDAVNALEVAAKERVSAAVIVGDAFARPLVEALEGGATPPPSLRHLLSSGAILSRPLVDRLTRFLPDLQVLDVLGASEAGRQAMSMTTPSGTKQATFGRDPGTVVLDATRSHRLEPGDDEIGWMATYGRVPLGYLGDPVKSAATFPVIDGVRHVIPGDRARIVADGTIELHGRESVTINSGGEKIFAEEVERAIKEHPGVADVLVVGRPSETWGSEVVAVVAPRTGVQLSASDLATVAGAHVARFKVPKAFLFVDRVPRSPSGKPDYGAARALWAVSPSSPPNSV